jgi:hypothetical protein
MSSQDTKKRSRRVPAPFDPPCREFGEALNRTMAKHIRVSLSHLIAPENNLQLNHGHRWEYGREDGSGHQGTLKEVSAKHTLPFASIASNDLTTLSAFIESLTEAMIGGISRSAYETVGAVADRVGNTVSGTEAGSPARAFLEALKKVEFGVGSDGRVTLPALHAHPDLAEKMLADLDAQGPEFRQEVERIKQQKTAAALEAERSRRQRYKKDQSR